VSTITETLRGVSEANQGEILRSNQLNGPARCYQRRTEPNQTTYLGGRNGYCTAYRTSRRDSIPSTVRRGRHKARNADESVFPVLELVVRNQLLALFQAHKRCMTLGPIASFNRWKELSRYVKRGEKAIELCMPVTIKRTVKEPRPDGMDVETSAWPTRMSPSGPIIAACSETYAR
jgi:hypothetical protein